MTRSAVPLAGLIVLDGWALNPRKDGNAVEAARTPVMDGLMKKCPHATLVTWGESVGLPRGQMGNSEVGHLNLGAGRIVYQDLTRIDRAVEDGELARNPILLDSLRRTKQRGAALHLFGLHSPGGVHSHILHLHALLRIAADQGIERIRVHAITDGRDVAPRSARADLE
ncbi:MAG TPA: 2,3-bisphosphoglycerate-independent phosphoglycerate mutase, partial [Candidatus Angelobacter sp.]|nr:2,3-bisphosphoglycerate-independent phosphoglycerate mutase [Candidatus Angelobacter sp.]